MISWVLESSKPILHATPIIEVPQATRTGSTSILKEALGTNLDPDKPAQILPSGSSSTKVFKPVDEAGYSLRMG